MPEVFAVNEFCGIYDGWLEWATDANVEHVINDMVGRECGWAKPPLSAAGRRYD